MRKRIFTFLLLIMTMTSIASAYSFMVDGICYNVNSDGTSVTVTYYNNYCLGNDLGNDNCDADYYSYDSEGGFYEYYAYIGNTSLSGQLNIPSTVTYGDKTYSVTSIGRCAFRSCGGLTSVTIPNSVTSIDIRAFYGCYRLKSVTIPISVTSIGYQTFKNSGLTSVTIPNSVSSIGEDAFKGCSGLTSVTIGNSVTSIGSSAFEGCSGLIWVDIGNSVTSIGSSAFYECSNLIKVYITDLAAWCNIDFGSNDANPLSYAPNLYLNGIKVTNLVIPNTVTSIKPYTFSGCSGLTSVTIPNSVTSIGGGAFSGCTGLTSVTIPNSVTSIGYSVFYNCTGLTSVTIPNSVTSIGMSAFNGCSGLTSVTIPNSVTTIGWSAFQGCTGLTSVTIPNSVTEIGSSAFADCSGLTSVTIGNSVKTIGAGAFKRCSGLTSVTIPNSVTSIGNYAFYGCTELLSVYTKILEPEIVSYGSSIFGGVSTNYCKLYVPVGTLESYQFTAPWNEFLNIEEYTDEPTFIKGDANGDGTIDVADYVDVASYILERDPQPFYFAAADIDEDNSIDVGDLVGVAYLALNYEGAPMLSAAVGSPDAASLAMNAVVNNTASGQYEVAINLSNNVALSALQMDINLPQGMTLVDASLSDRASASHQVVFNQLANGDYRLLASSSALKTFKNYDGTVLTLTLSGSPSGNGYLSGIKLATPTATCYSVDDIELNFTPTVIDNVITAVRIYSEGGKIIIDSPIDGTAQIILPNGMNKTVKVATGRNVFETPTKGLIIVKMGNEVKKLQF